MSTVEETVRLMKGLRDRGDGEAIDQDRDWMSTSLSSAMRGMENEESPSYSTSDLKEVFQ